MDRPIERIVIVGGGTAGWLAACRLAAWSDLTRRPLHVTLVEDPETPTIGVGEGTWPTMRATLDAIGIAEKDFLAACDASFKQGSLFEGWRNGGLEDSYLHPFTLPPEAEPNALVAAWRSGDRPRFAAAMTSQDALVRAGLSPRQPSMPPFAGVASYGYHLDAGKFAALLRDHGTARLGVVHRQARIASVEGTPNAIEAVCTTSGERIAGDLFFDCTGFAALLIAGHCGADWVDRSEQLLNDRALAVQVPVDDESPIASATRARAHRAGWLWDIGLPTRRGIGCVYSSAYLSDDEARDILADYVTTECGQALKTDPRLIRFPTGHRDRFWIGNCIALGLSAGFIEPLEASAIVLVEASLSMILDGFPATARSLDVVADRFNRTFRGRWDGIVEFLKLHYVLSQREEPYWQAHRDAATISPRLAAHLALWTDQPPSQLDFPLAQEMFPPASYQYVYYGMGGESAGAVGADAPQLAAALDALRQRERALLAGLPTNRAYLDGLAAPAARHVHGGRI